MINKSIYRKNIKSELKKIIDFTKYKFHYSKGRLSFLIRQTSH